MLMGLESPTPKLSGSHLLAVKPDVCLPATCADVMGDATERACRPTPLLLHRAAGSDCAIPGGGVGGTRQADGMLVTRDTGHGGSRKERCLVPVTMRPACAGDAKNMAWAHFLSLTSFGDSSGMAACARCSVTPNRPPCPQISSRRACALDRDTGDL